MLSPLRTSRTCDMSYERLCPKTSDCREYPTGKFTAALWPKPDSGRSGRGQQERPGSRRASCPVRSSCGCRQPVDLQSGAWRSSGNISVAMRSSSSPAGCQRCWHLWLWLIVQVSLSFESGSSRSLAPSSGLAVLLRADFASGLLRDGFVVAVPALPEFLGSLPSSLYRLYTGFLAI